MRGLPGRFAFLVFTAVLLCAGDKKPKPKPAVVELQKFRFSIDGAEVNIEGTVHNAGERTIEKLLLSFHFFDSEHMPVSTLKMEIDNEAIDPGEDSEIHAGAHEPPRAISVEVTAADRGEKDLKVVNPGPYRIE